ncbi:MAG: prephenate dehydrogenase [Chloroflexota bacterium]
MPDPKLAQQRIGIVGLGLMGGSLAMALRGHCAHLVAIEPQPAVRLLAQQNNVVDAVTDDFAVGITDVDMLVFATPVRTTLNLLARLPTLRPDGCMVMDLGSTKQAVITAMNALPPTIRAIGGHPMCGKESSGLAAASADLYHNQVFVLCRSPQTTPDAEALALEMVATVRANPIFLEPGDHDHIVAAVSHLPYLVSAALMRVVADEREWDISASGFRDVSRLAGSDTRMMLDILMTNRPAILAALDDYQDDLDTFKRLLQDANETALTDWLAEARVRYAAYRRHRSARPSASGTDGNPDSNRGSG